MQQSILIVEDEPIIAWDNKNIALECGYKVIGIVKSGDEAVELALANKPDVILLDINLRGLDGHSASNKIRKVYSPKMVYITAEENAGNMHLSKDEFLISKPFTNLDLHNILCRISNSNNANL